MKILIAPDKFKDALDAPAVAEALVAGAREARPNAAITTCPLGDGGEGTGSVLAVALGAQECRANVLDPLGRERVARWWHCPGQRLALVEMAEASGLALLTPQERNALTTTSYGTGQLLKAAIEAGCRTALLCVGGSATVDGGAGCLQALGYTLFDRDGAEIREPAIGGMLARVGRFERRHVIAPIAIRILCDVDNPLLGPRGAAHVFAPQKGASPATVRELEHALEHWAGQLFRGTSREVAQLKGTGAAGGLPAGLVAGLDAEPCSGFDEVARCVGLRERLTDSDLCLTGEGRIDDQTAYGKVVAGVARNAAELDVPTIAFAGAVRTRTGQAIEDLVAALGVKHILVVTPANTPLERALADTAKNLRAAAHRTLTRYA